MDDEKIKVGDEVISPSGKTCIVIGIEMISDIKVCTIRQLKTYTMSFPKNITFGEPTYIEADEVQKTGRHFDGLENFMKELDKAEKMIFKLCGMKRESEVCHDPIDKLDKLELSTRTYNCLKRANFNTIGDIIEKDAESADSQWIFKVRYIGKKSVEEICTKLVNKYNYTLKYWRDKS